MRFILLRSLKAVLLSLVCLAVTPAMKADTYSLGVIGTTSTGFFVAGDDFGDYTLQLYSLNACSSSASVCFANYNSLTGQTTYSATQAVLRQDPSPIAGVGCTVSLPGAISLCNNGHQVLGGYYQGILGVWALDNGSLQRIWNGALAGPSIITPNGNVFFADGLHENLIVGLASPSILATPEPGSLVLLATGALGLLGAARRKLLQ